ncbi:hypothetical protein RFI_13240, partial [Reticulomyxa filosa]
MFVKKESHVTANKINVQNNQYGNLRCFTFAMNVKHALRQKVSLLKKFSNKTYNITLILFCFQNLIFYNQLSFFFFEKSSVQLIWVIIEKKGLCQKKKKRSRNKKKKNMKAQAIGILHRKTAENSETRARNVDLSNSKSQIESVYEGNEDSWNKDEVLVQYTRSTEKSATLERESAQGDTYRLRSEGSLCKYEQDNILDLDDHYDNEFAEVENYHNVTSDTPSTDIS